MKRNGVLPALVLATIPKPDLPVLSLIAFEYLTTSSQVAGAEFGSSPAFSKTFLFQMKAIVSLLVGIP